MTEKVPELVARLRACRLDKDNYPRMDGERACSVKLAEEAADALERVEAEARDNYDLLHEHIRRLEAERDEWKETALKYLEKL